ncbi:Hypothetical protein; putative membrane protein (plasmid) [Deinococcus deserti VCD115]|uniref:Uncharacterized protein n=2 Tax=Deinococcus TaxID=1298 RepID=C1D233_DEIDV|nr:hypothetical protein [Deinococcus deserti]ACO47472.1 Hypothetical protein; putative membrane protein [Deinococcus deserti VCD115]
MDMQFMGTVLVTASVAAFSWLTLRVWQIRSPKTARFLPLRFLHAFTTVYFPLVAHSYLETLHRVQTEYANDAPNIAMAWGDHHNAVIFSRGAALVIAVYTVIIVVTVRTHGQPDGAQLTFHQNH